MSRSSWRTVTSKRTLPSSDEQPGLPVLQEDIEGEARRVAATNSGTFGSSAATSWAVKSANIASSAESCTMRRGASPAEGTGWAPGGEVRADGWGDRVSPGVA